MCGIAGTVGARHPDVILRALKVAAKALEHRGPDGEGFFVYSQSESPSAAKNNVGLAHRRLAIIDLSESGKQPMTLIGSGLHIVLNGEIYNYRELRNELEKTGRRFASSSDTEVLLHAYAQWGISALLRLEGMFSFALLDAPRNKLLLVRDFFGIKPLFYSQFESSFYFASEIPALLQMSGVDRKANPTRVFEHLNYWTTDQGEDTFFASVKRLPAAHYMEINLTDIGNTRCVRYWDIERGNTLEISLPEAAQRVRELFLESVALHLRSDVPVAVALSGGTDSSSVVMGARRLLGSTADLATVSFISSDPQMCEEIWIDTVNLAAKTQSHKIQIDDAELGNDFERLIALQAEPFVTPVVYAQHRVFRKAHECGFKVLLEGQGADELLAGYPFYQQARLATLLMRGELLSAMTFLRHAPPRFNTGTTWLVTNALRRMLPENITRFLRYGKKRTLAQWISPAWAERNSVAWNAAPLESLSGKSGLYLRDMIYETVTATKLPGLLRYGDQNAMSVSVENRVPFLTPSLATFLFSMPEEYIIGKTGETKTVFREAMRGITPELVLRRKNKIGFEPPYRKWMNGMRDKAVSVLRDASNLSALDVSGIKELTSQIQARGIETDTVANRLWRLISLVQWARHFEVKFD
jgi:asparagine synthase (glutamine-hydrolysing)